MQASFGIVRLAHRSLTPLGEKFVQLPIEADTNLAEFEQKMARALLPLEAPLRAVKISDQLADAAVIDCTVQGCGGFVDACLALSSAM